MSSPAITWLDAATLVRVETAPTGWALQGEALSAMMELPWRVAQVGRDGLRGVFDHSDPAVTAALGKITTAVDELATVEVRDDVAVAMFTADAARPRAQLAGQIREALERVGARPLGWFVDAAGFALAVEGWRRDAVHSALTTATSMSGPKKS